MDIFDSVLGEEITRVINSASGNGVFVDAVIHANGRDIEVVKVLNIDILDDYLSNYTEEIRVSLLVSPGQVAHRIMPFKDKLEVSLKMAASDYVTGAALDQGSAGIERFRAVLVESEDTSVQANGKEIQSEFMMDLKDLEVIEFQLFRKAIEQIMLRSCGGSYRKTNKADLTKALLMQESSSIEVDQDYAPKGVDMIEPPDVEPREHIVIPHGTRVVDAIGYIHKNCGGIYPAGLSYFFKNDYWYVFPPYDYTRYNESDENLVILQVPPNKIPSIEHTYVKEGSVLTFISTGDSYADDQSEAAALNTGNGTRYSDAVTLFERPVTIEGNKAIASRATTNNEFVSSQRPVGFNNVTTSSARITSNSMYEASNLAAKEGTTIQVIWENSEPNLIRPGMQTKFLYFKNGVVCELRCVVVGMQTSIAWTGQGIVQGRHRRITALNLFAEKLVRES